MFISFALYTNDPMNINYEKIKLFNQSNFLNKIDLNKKHPNYYEKGMYLNIYLKSDIWKSESKNAILKAIADDEIRAMFICPSKNRILAPYDGGVDIIVETTEIRLKFENDYKNWLPPDYKAL